MTSSSPKTYKLGIIKKDSMKIPSANITNEHTVIIFDWDDTLLCTTFLVQNNLNLGSDDESVQKFKGDFEQIAKIGSELLQLAKQKGDVLIVTNSEKDWVELTSSKFIPSIIPYLKDVKIISARSHYESAYPTNPYMWKYLEIRNILCDRQYISKSFIADLIQSHNSINKIDLAMTVIDQNVQREKNCLFLDMNNTLSCKKNIISIGDSIIERICTINLAKIIPNALSKTVKFSDNPTLNQLLKQMQILKDEFEYISSYDGSLDFQILVVKE